MSAILHAVVPCLECDMTADQDGRERGLARGKSDQMEAEKVNQTVTIKMSGKITRNWHSMTQKVKTTEVAVSSVMQFTCNRFSSRFFFAIL